MCDHGRGLDGRTVASGRHRRQAVQAWLLRRKGRAYRQADGPNRAKIACSAILARVFHSVVSSILTHKLICYGFGLTGPLSKFTQV